MTKDLRVLAVDDEAPALQDLVFLLDAAEGVGEVLTARTGADALRILNERHDIDALFLDIRMPGLDGIELVKVLKNFRKAPEIAFVTAFDNYALTAFGLDVTDYLLKPVDADRLDETIRRIRTRTSSAAPAVPTGGALPRVEARIGDRRHVIDRDDVVMIEAEGSYARVFTADGDFLVGETISSLTSAWSPQGFVRIHRSFLVRSSSISEVESVDGKRTVVVEGRRLPVSRRYSKLLQDHLAGSA